MRFAAVDSFRHDVRVALRGMARSPGLIAAVVLTIGLGVGANAGMFVVLDRLLFQQPEGVVRPQEVNRIYSYGRTNNSDVHYADVFSVPDLEGMRAAVAGVADVEGYGADNGWLADGDSVRIQRTSVTAGYFRLLGVHAERGRLFSEDEMRYGDPRYVVVLSDALWRRRYASDPAIVGRRIHIVEFRDTMAFTVIGVAQPRFAGVDIDGDDMWTPVTARPNETGEGSGAWWTQRGLWVVSLLARVPAGTDVRGVDARLTLAYRRVNATAGTWFDTRTEALTAPLIEARGPRGSSAGERNVAVALRLAGMALVVLLLAAANAAALLLMRALRREREIAVRVALGISRSRLIAQLLIEACVIAVLAGGGALLMTMWTGGVLRAVLFTGVHWAPGIVDMRLAAVIAALALLGSFGACLAPISIVGARDLTAVLKSGSQEAGHPSSRLRSTLLVGQAALCVALLAGAGVFIQSLRRATHFDLGYDPSRLVVVLAAVWGTNPPTAGFDATAARLESPAWGAVVSRTPADGGGSAVAPFRLPGQDSTPAMRSPHLDMVDAGWFRVVGARITAGRALDEEDVRAQSPVAVVNAAMAERFWPGRSPVGECFFGWGKVCRRVVGVVADFRTDITAAPKPYYVVPMDQRFAEPALLIRLAHPVAAQDVAQIRSMVLAAVGPTTAQIVVLDLRQRLEKQVQPWRVAGTLFSVFGLLALLSAAAGVYGLVSYDVGRRTREIGIRTTLGATPGRVVQDVLWPAVRVLAAGIAVGVALALATGRVLAALLFETSPYDPPTLVVTAATLLAVAVVASFVPAWRATRIDPVIALRSD